ncbi:Spx/MgsR family RNA polymerase-binding regulatory protein [Castellaniella sp.]|uniref:Spx/MgsR family RNA polymerase-binding regulatory protein n=1 Tax=Castellaniella sp. TaxID=1955812 RepID=UPI002AFE72F8|nr:Spx/MgsR family RNA polymerase-binding regulatory protein [Castellaniella sp.]
MTATIYGIKNCDTMKKAFTWLGVHSVDFTFHDYRVAGITRAEVAAWVAEAGLDKVLNKASKTFRALPEAVRDGLNEARAIDLMVAEPTMIKRPVLATSHGTEVGFKPERYATIFGF